LNLLVRPPCWLFHLMINLIQGVLEFLLFYSLIAIASKCRKCTAEE